MAKSSIEYFVKLNNITSLYRPPQSNGHAEPSSSSSTDPSLIVICSWLGAAPKHITKYTDGYRLAFPHAEILLIESTLSGTVFGADLSAAIDVLAPYAKQAGSSAEKRVLLSLFSNGGANISTLLGTTLLDKYGTVPFHAMIFDCCPSSGDLRTVVKAIAFSFPRNPVVRFIAWYTVYAVLIAYASIVTLLRIENLAARFLRVLNDPAVFSTAAPRLYMYSRKDELVTFEYVKKHAEGARRAGYSVREEEFLTASHCALLNEDSTRYWNAVRAHASK